MHNNIRNYTPGDFVWVNKVKMSSAPLHMCNPRDTFNTQEQPLIHFKLKSTGRYIFCAIA